MNDTAPKIADDVQNLGQADIDKTLLDDILQRHNLALSKP